MTEQRKLFLYIAMSLDGYIAAPDDDISFLLIVEKTGEDYGYSEFIKSVDTVIIGKRTFDKVKSMGYEPHKDKEVYIITRSRRSSDHYKYYSGSLKDLIIRLKKQSGKNIFCDGGAEIVNELLKDNLIDEFIISIIPVMLGDGISLFRNGRSGLAVELINSVKYDTGLVQLHYRKANIPYHRQQS
jgi:dihydrofolate reductase